MRMCGQSLFLGKLLQFLLGTVSPHSSTEACLSSSPQGTGEGRRGHSTNTVAPWIGLAHFFRKGPQTFKLCGPRVSVSLCCTPQTAMGHTLKEWRGQCSSKMLQTLKLPLTFFFGHSSAGGQSKNRQGPVWAPGQRSLCTSMNWLHQARKGMPREQGLKELPRTPALFHTPAPILALRPCTQAVSCLPGGGGPLELALFSLWASQCLCTCTLC